MHRTARSRFMVAFCVGIVPILLTCPTRAAGPDSKISFNRDIRPILSDKCFACHGPDTAKRKAGLRLDQREDAVARRDGVPAIVPGDSARSEVLRRIVSADSEEKMPPADSTLKLAPSEIELLRRWIDEGAEYQPHWSFIPPSAVIPPASAQLSGARHPVDAFIRARLDREGLSAATEADKNSLIRRVSLDLNGLPPTATEIDDFLADNSPDCFEKLVDRLLASPRYGERMAVNWLDAARYADTNGYQTDGPRFMWRWRDWVINAFNRNQPFDQFTIDQLAGDLINDPTENGSVAGTSKDSLPNRRPSARAAIANDRLIATGFNRNHRGNAEGGIIPEEFRVEYVVDRVETTGTVWLGLTIGCARCHDHKYDPIRQREFYQLFAYFNQVPEPGKYIRNDNSMPYLPAPTPDQQRRLTALDQDRTLASAAWKDMEPAVLQGMRSLAEKIRSESSAMDWRLEQNLDSCLTFDGDIQVTRPTKAERSAVPSKWRDDDAAFAEGRIGQAAQFDGRRWIELSDTGDFREDESFAISCWVKPRGSQAMTILARMDHDNSSRGYELRREANGRLQALFSGRILDDLIRIETTAILPADEWSHVFVSYDGSSAARGVAIRLDGQSVQGTVITDLLSNPIRVKRPLVVGAGGSAQPFVGLIDEVRLYLGRLTPHAEMSLAAGDSISQIARRGIDDGTPPADLEKFREFYLAEHAPPSERIARQAALDANARYLAYLATIPTTMVMQDADRMRQTFLLKRGEYDKPGDLVEPALPAIFPVSRGNDRSAKSTPGRVDRLDLARSIVSADNPLTARVTVNRFWQSLFGVGLVKTAEDFGIQGEAPSHPELLDWLAVEFGGSAESGAQSAEPLSPASRVPRSAWDMKSLLRQLVISATYRQSSRVDPMSHGRDPDNRWLGRGPRFRLPAEMIRDSALAISGLLIENIGGPSVKPYQPPGLWEELSADAVPGPFSIYVQDHGANLYRRGIYTFRRRTIPPPSLAIFDASPREACRVSLPRTNTPLQALNLMNDVTYIEAARVLAESAMKQGGASAPSRLSWAFRRILSRQPVDRELTVLVDGLDRRWQSYRQHPLDAEQLLKLGEIPKDNSLPQDELAAYTATMSVIFNLDEFVSKQ